LLEMGDRDSGELTSESVVEFKNSSKQLNIKEWVN